MSSSDLPPRLEYGARLFDREELTADPMELFAQWFSEAIVAEIAEMNGMCLCTADPDEGPDGRIVLLKGYGPGGFTFFSNFDSAKGNQLAKDPRASLVFWWQPARRQVRVRGAVERVSDAESREYFASRPRDSQLGAWASSQSQPVTSREELEQLWQEVGERYPGEVPRPPHWGGYRLLPHRMEFWQGRDNRLHDRFRYICGPHGEWTAQRLMP